MEIEKQKKIRVYKKNIEVPTPTNEEVQKYLRHWDSLDNYRLQEDALNKLFFNVYPKNVEIEDILIKVAALNDFYSTNIYYPFNMAQHILELNIDDRMRVGDLSLVNDIATLETKPGKVVNLYSFASKYCSHHYPEIYPIYDRYVEDILKHFRDNDSFYNFGNSDLKDYSKFKNIILNFQNHYEIRDYNIKFMDRYLWQVGKEYFPRSYKSSSKKIAED